LAEVNITVTSDNEDAAEGLKEIEDALTRLANAGMGAQSTANGVAEGFIKAEAVLAVVRKGFDLLTGFIGGALQASIPLAM
jgi:hypothetical protein